jgi:hypothetical protein
MHHLQRFARKFDKVYRIHTWLVSKGYYPLNHWEKGRYVNIPTGNNYPLPINVYMKQFRMLKKRLKAWIHSDVIRLINTCVGLWKA